MSSSYSSERYNLAVDTNVKETENMYAAETRELLVFSMSISGMIFPELLKNVPNLALNPRHIIPDHYRDHGVFVRIDSGLTIDSGFTIDSTVHSLLTEDLNC